MRTSCLYLMIIVLMTGESLVAGTAADAQTSSRPKLYVVGTAHLDTQWRWTIQTTIEDYIPDTFRRNIALMERHPDYVFSFEGSFRYMLMDEYYPDEFERVRPFIDSGQWRVTGSWVDAVDVNLPSFESLVRQTLYGNGYFQREFGKVSRDIFLPDCFGFGYALPSIAAHAGLGGISTQKLTWGSCVGIPFDIGIWAGVDGSRLAAGFNPGSYVAQIKGDLSRDTTWLAIAERQGEATGLYAAYRYFGTGDTGGSPTPASVEWLQKSIDSDGPLQVESVGADDLIGLVASTDRERLPLYDGELVMTSHGVGCYTSQAAMKRWNRQNELLADAAERASVMAHRLGSLSYPREMLRDSWVRFLWHQFHDDLTGTSIPAAYEYSWNDELLCQNRFAAMLEHAVESVAPALDTSVDGIPVIVYNPLSLEREDIVEAKVHFDAAAPADVRVFDPDGRQVPVDVVETSGNDLLVRFPARAPAVGFAVYDLRPAGEKCDLQTGLRITPRTLENERYLVRVNDAGEVASIFDKRVKRELLSEPIRFEFIANTPRNWPAWEIDYNDVMATPRDLWAGPARIRMVEEGLTRVALEIERKTAASVVRTTIRLATGEASGRVEFDTAIDWYERETLLKACFPVTSANDSVWYDLGLGAIRRGLNREKLYEVPGHQWADITSAEADYGVAILNDCRYGWDHPTPEQLRLTLIHTPGVADGWDWLKDERSQDHGHHRLLFAVQGHEGDWRESDVVQQAARLNQPLLAFQTTSNAGELGKRYSFLKVADPGVMVNAIKLAEANDEIVVRVRELQGRSHEQVLLEFDRPVRSAREINGMEETIGEARIVDGQLICSLTPFQPKAFAVTLTAPTAALERSVAVCVDLPFNLDGISLDADRHDGDFDGQSYTLAGELIPDTLLYRDVPFVFGKTGAGALNVVECEEQTIRLPDTAADRLCLLAAAVGGPATARFRLDTRTHEVPLQDYADHIGQWDNRLSGGELREQPTEITPAYINRLPVAWYGSHRHTPAGENDAYRFTYLFLVELELIGKTSVLTLPADDRIRILAATLVDDPYGEVTPAQPLYDETHNTFARIAADSAAFAGRSRITMSSPVPNTTIYYTLDGTEPGAGSLRYTQPINVTRTTTIKARGVKAGFNDSHVSEMTVTKLTLRDAVEIGEVAAGLHCRYYEGSWSRLPDFDTLRVDNTFTVEAVAVPERARDEDYGLTMHGFVKVPADGVYSFSINSDDGSRLLIGDTLLVDNDGLHGDFERSGLIGLKMGFHPLTVHMFQCKGGEALGLSLAGPALPKQSIPAAMLYHRK